MQPVDFTTLMAVCAELRSDWLPARCEQVVQRDRTTICIALRTIQQRGWLTISWHPQAARLHMDNPPPRVPDTFTFSQQLKHQLNGFALTEIKPVAPWERALDLGFARRPGDPIQWHLYVEVMGKYSNVVLVNAHNQIVTAAHQVSESQSSVRPISTGSTYVLPPAIVGSFPNLEESQQRWQERILLIPTTLKQAFFKAYSGLSSALVRDLVYQAGLDLGQPVDSLTAADWERLFAQWQSWLWCLKSETFQSSFFDRGYSVLVQTESGTETVQALLREYYTNQLNQQAFDRLNNQLTQRLKTLLKKLRQKENTFLARLEQAVQADDYRQQADLLMAYSYQWQPGMDSIRLEDFETGAEVTIPLSPEKNAIQNAQALYKRHQKLKRSRQAITPLLEAVQSEVAYLEQVDAAVKQTVQYESEADLVALQEIRDELIQQGYLEDPTYRPGQGRSDDSLNVRKFLTPSGFDVWVGRNNRQNDLLTFQAATDYDLWFHTQEIPGSHVLLRLDAGQVPTDEDLQFTADVAAYFSRARQADQVPVVYTQPRYLFKPKGALPGMVTYTHETVLWGQPTTLRDQSHPSPPAPVLVNT
ncbi:NFACT RNA binding domain-containing protein [Oscillatoria sp. CS-180]|uniref:Rqc2 family fibronectin-binding protein n=1 Tax=Oscillatoria sp. CS-180 TaxID=3021720 RepID=UPI002330E6FB|nr:NFACT RNA binding domain-containing protein [Oscillatoria sp. CS-180]MDB9526808.1 NFACT RNA binding domain-containing protein [Oscillatoria sp. CS-180]